MSTRGVMRGQRATMRIAQAARYARYAEWHCYAAKSGRQRGRYERDVMPRLSLRSVAR